MQDNKGGILSREERPKKVVNHLAVVLLTLLSALGSVVHGAFWRNGRPVVDVPGKGRVVGIEEQVNNFTYYAFRGIPFAEPPLGPLRFKEPVESKGWSGDLDASSLPSPCSQDNSLVTNSSEDCLYVSIYTPENALLAEEPLAVLVYIHGGGLTRGSMKMSDQCHALLEKGVIMASLQYRLGVLGFLSTEDSVAPGNAGLKDQTMAIKWIKDNIAAFGGHPEKITIFGESAGSHSVHLQLLIPAAKGLFRGAIMQSGTALGSNALGRDFLKIANDVGNRFGCPQNTTTLISCLQNVPAENLTNLDEAFEVWDYHPPVFAPRIDGSYLPGEPVEMLEKDLYHHVPIIIGTTRDEGAAFAIDMYAYPEVKRSLVDNFTVNGPASLDLLPCEDPLNTPQKVYDYYLPGLVIEEEQADNATRMYSHRKFHIPTDWSVILMSAKIPVYMYEFSHRGEHGFMDAYLEQGLDLPPAKKWVCHGDDLQYFFDGTFSTTVKTEDDLAVREVFTAAWANFAKTLNPTPDGSLGYRWDKTEISSMRHFNIIPNPHMADDNRYIDRQFWDTLPLYNTPNDINGN